MALNGAEFVDFAKNQMFINPSVFDERVWQMRSSKTPAFIAIQFGAVWPIRCPIDTVFLALVSTRSGIHDFWSSFLLRSLVWRLTLVPARLKNMVTGRQKGVS